MYAGTLLLYAARFPVYLVLRLLGTRLWALPALYIIIYAGGEMARGTFGTVFLFGLVWLSARILAGWVEPNGLPRPKARSRRVKPAKTPVAKPVAAKVKSTSAETAKKRLDPQIQKLMTPAGKR